MAHEKGGAVIPGLPGTEDHPVANNPAVASHPGLRRIRGGTDKVTDSCPQANPDPPSRLTYPPAKIEVFLVAFKHRVKEPNSP